MTKIYVAGHSGMVGSAIVRLLQKRKQKGESIELITRTHAELDLTEQASIRDFFRKQNQMWLYWLQRRWVEYMPIIRIRQILFTKT